MNSPEPAFLPPHPALAASADLPAPRTTGRRRERHPLILAVVLLAHGIALWGLSRLRPPEALPTPPTIEVALLPAIITPPTVRPPEPPREPPKPRPAEPRKTPTMAPKPAPTPTPVVTQEAPPTSTAPTALTAPAAPPAPAPEPTPTKATAAPEPVVEARYDAAYLNNQTPYPPLARRMGESGTVRLRVLVSAEGRAEAVELVASSGSPRLDNGARDAVNKWRFVPAKQGQKPISQWVTIPVVYKFEES